MFVCLFVCCYFFLQLRSYFKYKIKTGILASSWRLYSISLWMFRICDALLFKSSFPTWDQFVTIISSALTAGNPSVTKILCFVIICLFVCLFVVAFHNNMYFILCRHKINLLTCPSTINSSSCLIASSCDALLFNHPNLWPTSLTNISCAHFNQILRIKIIIK